MRALLVALLAVSPVLADGTAVVRRVAAPPATGDLLTETYDATGYDDGDWVEVTDGALADPDSSTCGSGTGWANQCLRVTGTAFDNPHVTNTFAATTGDLWAATNLKLTWTADDTGDRWGILALDDSTAETGGISVNIRWIDATPTIQLVLFRWSSGGVSSTLDTATFTSGSQICLEVYMNATTAAWEWKINGASEGSGTSSGFSATPTTLHIGATTMPGGSNTDASFDDTKVGTTGWLGCN